MSRHVRELSVAAAYALLLAILGGVAPTFYRESFRDSLVSAAPVLVAAVGMTFVILTRNIDISIGSQFSVCAIVAAVLVSKGMPVPFAAIAAVACGAALGAVNGGFVAGLGLPSIVVTLATMVAAREGLLWVRQGAWVHVLPDSWQWFGLPQSVGQLALIVASGTIFALAWFASVHLAAGRAVYATGSDPEAARLAGVRPRGVVFGTFVLMGALAGLAAVLNAVRFPQVAANTGDGLELKVIAAVVVGGTAVSGGRGTLPGTLAGVLLLGTVGTALVFLNVLPEWEKVVQGTIILVAVAADGLRRRADA
jgi:rhamnose transport system permease protein